MTKEMTFNQKLIRLRPLFVVILVGSLIGMLFTPAFGSITTALQEFAMYMLEAIVTDGISNPVLDYFVTPLYENDTFSTAWALILNIIQNVIKPLALGLVGLGFVIKIVQICMDVQQVTIEKFVTPFLYLLGSYLFIFNIVKILRAILKLGSSLAVGFSYYAFDATSEETIAEILAEMQSKMGTEGFNSMASAFVLVLKLFIPYLIHWLGVLLMKIICWGILLELVVRCMLVPLFTVDFMFNGFQGIGMRQAKALLATVSSGAIVIAISGVQAALTIDIVREAVEATTTGSIPLTAIGQMLVIMFASITLMGKATSLAREAFGA